ncbi:MAG: SIMPL domain-containing protein [Candidatus Staskawiczbacteria bacterium]|nr:SIMPL domain-containing protein [Candidatus Staskawiczbacteria bacterium]
MEQDMMKFLNKVFMLTAVLIVGVLIFFVGQLILQERSIDQQNNYQITVSGEGTVYAKPDVAQVNLGVTSQAGTVADVTKANTEKMNAVIEAVKGLNIDEKDIQTTNYSLTPVYDNYVIPTSVPTAGAMMYPVRTGSAVTGYKLEQDIQVKIRDFSKVSDVLSQSTAKGANVVGDLQFVIDKPEQFKEQARAKAIAQAKDNAQNLSKESGVSLGKLINVYENYVYPMAYSTNSAKLGMGGGVADFAPAPTIQPGQQEISVTINLTYQVR